MSQLISLKSRELYCQLAQKPAWYFFGCEFSLTMSNVKLLTFWRMIEWGTPISNCGKAFFFWQTCHSRSSNCMINKNFENARWNVYAFFLGLTLQGDTWLHIFLFFYFFFIFFIFTDSPFKVSLKNLKFKMLLRVCPNAKQKWREHTP